MSLYSPPPALHTFEQDKPTLLVCWWITLFCTTIILLRIAGRFVRTEKLFTEDTTAAIAIIPLWIRMGCVHVILLYGTNNAQFVDPLSDEEIQHKQIASGLVLASRIFHALTLWILKSAILDFFKRLTSITWKRSYHTTLFCIRCSLVATFIAVVISDLAECRPFSNYYQVLPDPGGQCRQGYAQLLTMATCNVITDLLLVLFPIPIILRSNMGTKRKIHLVLLFSLSLGVVGVTLYRVPHVIWQDGSQQIRSLLASVELLFATSASNALVLGSFVRDRGVKKIKFQRNSVAADSIDRSSDGRRPTIHKHWGSDEDLVRDLGLGVERELRDAEASDPDEHKVAPAPIVRLPDQMAEWQFPTGRRSQAEHSDDAFLSPEHRSLSSRRDSVTTPRKVSFFDPGGLLSDDTPRSIRAGSSASIDPFTPSHAFPPLAVPAGRGGLRRGSQAMIQDFSGFLSPFAARTRTSVRSETEMRPISPHTRDSHHSEDLRTDRFFDPGGLLR